MAVVKSTKRKLKNDKAIKNCLAYVTNPSKCFKAEFSDGGEFSSPLKTAEFYKNIRIAHNKNEGIFTHHYVQSFSKTDEITPEQAHKIGMDFAKKGFFGYQVLVVTHTDCDHMHNHFIINSVSDKGLKWHDKTQTREHLQNISDELCVKNNLSVIESRGKGLDQATYQLGLRGKSWKFALTCDLDEAMKFCKTKDEFINFLYLRGYDVKFTEKNITITKEGQKKGIRVDTLAKQFGNKYTKLNLEKAMNFWERPKKFVKIENTKKFVKTTYDGEFQRFEKYLFEQINKPEVIETEKSVSNFSLKEILESQGKNFKGEIDLLELVKLKELDFLFYAEKFRDTATVSVAEYNKNKLKDKVDILSYTDKILLQQRNKNSRIYAEIRSIADKRGEKVCYKIVDEMQLNKLKNSTIRFSYYSKSDGKFNIAFNQADLENVNFITRKNQLQLGY